VRVLHQLSLLPAYRDLVLPLVPLTARHDPRHAAVMMGYDFHLDPLGNPWLIEVNTNAGGGLLSYLAHHPAAALAGEQLPVRLRQRFLATFAEEMQRFSGDHHRPRHIAIVDERPPEQFLYGEMQAFSDLFQAAWGSRVTIADPDDLQADERGVFADGERVDLVYNRHCDFYLESPALAGLRTAWLAGSICLTPNPFLYGLLADKRRMVLWSSPRILGELDVREEDKTLLAATVPETRLLATLDRDEAWRRRNGSVFKPVNRFGSRGVFLGRKISRSRFDTLLPEQTLVQREIPPSTTPCGAGEPMKTDFRLYAYRNRILGVAARLYHGQVTNMQSAGAGFAPVQIV
jgi:hypothetical protein